MKKLHKNFISRLRGWLHLKNKNSIEDRIDSSLPVELFSADQMEKYGKTLALSHTLTPKAATDILLGRLADSENRLIKTWRILTKASKTSHRITPAGEWILDNFYLIEEQIRISKRHLPKGYGRGLPQLANGYLQGYPRVYHIALEAIAHGDGRWDLNNLKRFISAYQAVSPLTLGELWAIPIMLRLALIENLSYAGARVAADRIAYNLADSWANQMVEIAVSEPKKLVLVIADMARSGVPMTSAFVAELVRRLQGSALRLSMTWLEQQLMEDGLTIEQLVQAENYQQAANQVTISNSIASLRRLSEVDWREFVELMSVVDQALQTDPAGVYGKMDFATRDRYRHAVERLARAGHVCEEKVALTAIDLSRTHQTSVEFNRCSHVGYYLIDKGLPQLKKQLAIRPTYKETIRHFFNKSPLVYYLGLILLITIGITYTVVLTADHEGLTTFGLIVLGITAALCVSQLALTLSNWLIMLLIKPQPLPKMDFSRGIPVGARTLVVVPAMLSSVAAIESLVEALEVRFLGNRDDNLHFALLTDFNDASQEHLPDDELLLNTVRDEIAALNKRYSNAQHDIFFLFHRARYWNPKEGVWMGHERKRGKLNDLNALLRGNNRSLFSLIVGCTDILPSIKYIITLDTDTQLPREAARQFVATMVHPLNRPSYEATNQRVVEGYGILQPRIAEALQRLGATQYARLIGSEPGIDPYTRIISDVYQDLFSEGSFIGKGIYDVDAFQELLGQRFPENRILSHDLLEGCYLRSGLLSDVPLYEQSPSSYLTDTKRRSRWIRGDWQLIGWLLPKVLNKSGQRIVNPLSALSRWKLFDNLRRSMVPIALIVFLSLSWSLLSSPNFWVLIILSIVLLPTVLGIVFELFRKSSEILLSQHLTATLRIIRQRLSQIVMYITFLPHEAWYSLNAILRTCWRMSISHRHLLEWTASDQLDRGFLDTSWQWIKAMWIGPVFALVTFGFLIVHQPTALFLAIPFIALWFISPLVARWLSQPCVHIEAKLTTTQLRFLHSVARKTWGFFETFVTAEDHWLPPDNYQEAPIEVLAHRTSPTNMGLALLANLTAYDFSYLTTTQLLTRTAHSLETMAQLERYRGHFYNWYDTQTLQPLQPRYISTVDSGNLVGHLLTLRQGLLALPDSRLLDERYLNGLADTLDVLAEVALETLELEIEQFRQLIWDVRFSFTTTWTDALLGCDKLCRAAEQIRLMFPKEHAEAALIEKWAQKLLVQCQKLHDELSLFDARLPTDITLRAISCLVTDDPVAIAARECALARIALIDVLAAQAWSFSQIDHLFLYDPISHLLTIGFNVDEQQRDRSSYDLLSSEARLGNFVAIAQGQLPQESWFALGRLLMSTGSDPVLVSWSGSMFEYLMPQLVMPSYADTLLDQTNRSAVHQQIEYGKQRGVPWGVSESGFNALDTNLNYLYRAFGVPGLGLKRGLVEDLVIAPYASAMALMIAPEKACINLQRLVAEGAAGQFGFYEAIDYTASRLPWGMTSVLVRSCMTHHQGMVLLALSYLLNDQPMQKRFIADPLFQATLLLLQERVPKPVATYSQITLSSASTSVSNRGQRATRLFNSPNTRAPQVQLLSNGRYHVVITQAGGGYSSWKDLAVTRWREDTTSDNWGLFCYLRDVDSGAFWSTAYQPTLGPLKDFKAIFSEAHAEFNRRDYDIETRTEIVVSPEDDVELRRLRIRNRSKIRRTLEFTSYAEVVLARQADDQAQPAFSNLFVETELLTQQNAILATRRPPNEKESPPWLCHMLNVYTDHPPQFSFETDRANFVGRARTLANPYALTQPGDLSGTVGPVLDPIIAIRCKVTLEPGAFITLDLVTGVAETRENCIILVEKYYDRHLANRIFGLAWTHSQVLLHQLNISEADAQLYTQLAGSIIYARKGRRADATVLAKNRRGQSALWPYSISGDLPIILLHVTELNSMGLVRQLIQAQAYWRRKGLLVDLVILNEESVSYRQTLQDQLLSLVTTANTNDHNGGIFIRVAEQLPAEDRILLQSVARIVLSDKRGTLAEQLKRPQLYPVTVPRLKVSAAASRKTENKKTLAPLEALQFFNGLGGFSADGSEYIIKLAEGKTSPAPWVNVLANPNFGTLVSESGQGYTWTENAHEFRLTPWDNDPIQDSSGEAFYLRDEETGRFWSATALPCRGSGDYITRHGFGYSVFEHSEDGIHSELWQYVDLNAALKFSVLKIRNESARRRRVSATGYVEWVLGDVRSKTAMHLVTQLTASGALLAQNHYNTEFGERTAFFDASTPNAGLKTRTITGDRTEFLGRNSTRRRPAALERVRLSGHAGAGFDPCGAIQLVFDLTEGETREIVFTLGAASNPQEAETLALNFRGATAAQTALQTVRAYWQTTLGVLQVTTPDPAVNFLMNGWLVYQVLSSRLWGRSGYYQSGGAFGFRDQLQDVMALVHAEPRLLRAQLLLCAAHQFVEGDVQHWWHPPLNRGVRTRCSDDYLWLPFAMCRYVEATGDLAILSETIPFLQGRALNANEESYYDLPTISAESVSLYQHGVRAILNGLKFGLHGLPLMGSGDWNDGMNLVGEHGKGESVWLGFFLYTVLKRFAGLAERYGDMPFAQRCLNESVKLQEHIELNAWDGEWYRRAYFDDGTPLGSAKNTECRIDSIAQSWSVLSGVAKPERAKMAMAALNRYLVNAQQGLIKLLDPPFDKSALNPGYIKGYVPGVRENGGQYTHAAIWAAMAFAELGETERAWQLLTILNPINHGRTAEEIAIYKIEPYVLAGDVYSVVPHTGRGGWSWYTGSAGWLYRFITESLLGVQLEEGKQLRLQPCLPLDWQSFQLNYRYGTTVYQINVQRGETGDAVFLDGVKLEGNVVVLQDDQQLHQITVIAG